MYHQDHLSEKIYILIKGSLSLRRTLQISEVAKEAEYIVKVVKGFSLKQVSKKKFRKLIQAQLNLDPVLKISKEKKVVELATINISQLSGEEVLLVNPNKFWDSEAEDYPEPMRYVKKPRFFTSALCTSDCMIAAIKKVDFFTFVPEEIRDDLFNDFIAKLNIRV